MTEANDDARVRVAAAEGLRALQSLLPDEPQLFDFLEQALVSPSPAAREVAVRLLRRTSDAGVATFVIATNDSQPRVRIEAVRALVAFHAGPEICALEDDPEPAVRAEVARALGQVADARGIESLRRLAGDADPMVRAAAVTAIPGVCPRGRCDEALLMAARDTDDEVRKAAASALARSAFEASGPALLRLATDSVVEVRTAALAALAARGVSAPATWRVLLDATHDVDHRVRAVARSVLRRTPERVA